MVNTIKLYKSLLPAAMKLAGVRPQKIEIEPGTVMNFWAPTRPQSNGNKNAVVFLHGFAGDGMLTWQSQVLPLARKYDVYVPDLLFFGGSATASSHRTVDFQAQSVAKGLAVLGLQRCTVVGFSYGGAVAFKLAETRPELVGSVVAACSVPALTESMSKECLEKMGFPTWSDFLLPNSANSVKTMFEVGSYELPRIPNRAFKDGLEVMFDHEKERAKLLEAMVIPGKDFTLPEYSRRVHLIWGEDDKIFSVGLAKELKEKLGNKATLECIEKAGHIAMLERPFVYNKCLKRILASIYEKRTLV
ncbi:dihydrolipoyllysine-residue acetyltransferase component of acetoin cleaving system-like [Rhodamnia argentea]|uniref:Dihydrolipoyllysine-residue acetyltransferase component of acetoin cleaving system-like n=1 Tax=Rhodamnia argentea TaxID=178133 RepID=A0A8B8NSE8_9MYRT|nr:dihydrolipoyllysine-residue acetyltransferase component of acetoin cleaving system-like [Rhodamnia argentea]